MANATSNDQSITVPIKVSKVFGAITQDTVQTHRTFGDQ